MRLSVIALGAAVAACSSSTVVVGDLQEVTSLKAIPNRDLDILFVIDNSSSMADKQQQLAQNFPRMMDALASLPDGLPNLHIGIATSDLGASGSHTVPAAGFSGCNGTGDAGNLVAIAGATAPFISDVENASGGRDRNYTGELRDVFGAAALVGDQGCGFEQHLGAMRRALDSNPNNAGFLRPDANLAVVILADEDDCSVGDSAFFDPDTSQLGPLHSFRCFHFGVTCDPDDPDSPGDKTSCKPREDSPYLDPVEPFADFLTTLKGDERKVLVAAVVGDPAPVSVALADPPGGGTPIPTLAHSCTFNGPDGPEVADPAVRISAFLDAFPERSRLTSICNADLSSALGDIGASARKLMGDPCLDTTNLFDSSDAPGIQPACEVSDIRDSAPDQPTTLPPCKDGSTTCFELVADAAACPSTADHLRVAIHRATDAGADVWTHVRCEPR